jgi:hypothetical protein
MQGVKSQSSCVQFTIGFPALKLLSTITAVFINI